MFGRRTNMADNSTPWASRWTVQFDPYSEYVNNESSVDELVKTVRDSYDYTLHCI